MKYFFILLILVISPFVLLPAQGTNLLDIDYNQLDSIFDEPSHPADTPQNPANKEAVKPAPVISDLKKRGIEFGFSYFFKGAVNPGWGVLPWELKKLEDMEEEEREEKKFSWAFGVEIGATIDINAQISENFRIKSAITYGIPGSEFSLGDFFFDYNFFNYVFFRAGKFEQSWGISPNFTYTNLLARIATQMQSHDKELPDYDRDAVSTNGTSYIMKLDVPIGIGGFQLLALTRANIAGGVIPYANFIGFGGKFNLAFSWADFNLGAFYQEYMAARAFLSVKTSIFKTDIYGEGLIGVNAHTDNSIGYAFNFGFTRSFFNNKLDINGEYFYYGEEKTEYFSPETEFRKEETLPFLEGHNFALNILYKFGGSINTRLFTTFYYGDKSFRLIPGVRITPLTNIDIYFAVPMALGDGYYINTLENYRYEHRPFSVLLYVNFSGSVRASQYY